ncbi:MAG: sugar phosphate isomerase/epimerase, partial [Abditibacteriales bacterium]|nr:sugar phosphate isomerase/epimerase [Abditibacteriales bacterium]MDW8366540.1 sugar phosphate isomerase/epimerase family protein [Abditibacteriales bacterium]
NYVEFHHALVPTAADEVAVFRATLDRYGLGVSMLTCAPDFTHPDAGERQRILAEMCRKVEVAQAIGAACIRGTIGCVHEGLSLEDGARYAAECLLRLAEYAEPRGVTVVTENHYRDRRWTKEDFGFRAEGFLAVFEKIKDAPVYVNFDFSNQIMSHEDPMSVLQVVKHKVRHCHVNDRKPGSYQHSLLGEGECDFDAIFRTLAEVGYEGYLSYEDGNPLGDDGTRQGFAFIRKKVAQYWT